MPVATPIDLEKFTEFAKPLVESGRYGDANEVLDAAIDALTREADEEAKQAWLVAAVEEGEASGLAEGNVIERVLERAGLTGQIQR